MAADMTLFPSTLTLHDDVPRKSPMGCRLRVSRMAIIVWLFVCGLRASPALPQKVDSTVAIGQSAIVWSSVLQEQRRLLIHLPKHYMQSEKHYPVLYLLDAETQFRHVTSAVQFLGSDNERMPEMIVIGITNTQRTRDLIPAADDAELRKETPEAGHADGFLKFLADELAPWVEARYRTVPYRILVGHSFGGLFCTYVITARPEVFQAHVAISPSLWWDKEAPVSRTEAALRRLHSPPSLFLSWADGEADIRDPTQKLASALSADPPAGLRWEHRYYAGEDHMSTPYRSFYDAMTWLFAGWRLPEARDGKVAAPTPEEVAVHYAALSKRFGYPIAPSMTALYDAAQALSKRGRAEDALELLRRNVREHAYLAEPYHALGQALEKLGRREEALAAYEAALRLAVNDENAYADPVGEFRAKVKELRLPR